MPKRKKVKKVLAIDPGTRYWGIAVFRDEKLSESMVKVLTANHSPANRLKEAKKVFASLIEDFEPETLVLEKPFFFWSKQAHFLDTLVDELKSLARKQKMAFYQYSPRTVRKVVCGNGNTTKKEMAKFLTSLYPSLIIHFKQEKRYKELYWGHMFDAVGVGVCHLKSIKE
jgi:Holliday junction resolvasome RuvABC endonuclease subunit